MRQWMLAAVAAVCMGMCACGPGAGEGGADATAPTGDADIVGTATDVIPFEPITTDCVDPSTLDPDGTVSSDGPRICTPEDNDTLGSVLVEENPSEPMGGNKIVFSISETTTLLRETREGREPASFADLRRGNRVAAWSTGAIAESYPAQATGSMIVILD